jgi:lactoylglutathione lyase
VALALMAAYLELFFWPAVVLFAGWPPWVAFTCATEPGDGNAGYGLRAGRRQIASSARSLLPGAIMPPMVELASLVLFTANVRNTADFYRVIGLDLEAELHEEGPVHLAVELGPVHFAIYEAAAPGRAPERRSSGDTFPGFYVESLNEATKALQQLGAPLIREHEAMPWGCRIVVEDPDGRAVEVNQREHCPTS